MKNYEIIVLGGGASGVMSAIIAGRKGKQVAIIDRESKPSKKILVTGNGRCNLTNKNMSSKFFNQNIDKYLSRFSYNEAMEFFNQLGLLTYFDDEGRAYPLSNSAKSVANILNLGLNESGVDFYGDREIQNIEKRNNGFLITTNKEEFYSQKLVFALGGNSTDLLSKTKHPLSPQRPSLVSIKTESTHALAGIKVSNCKVTLNLPNHKKFEEKGDVLFKESGLSGICIFNLSAFLARTGMNKGEIVLDILPEIDIEKLKLILVERKNLPRKVSQIFEGLIATSLGYEILNRVHVDEEKPINSLTDKEIELLAINIKNLNFQVKGIYDNNQIFSGGVKLDSLKDNLESKIYQNLFFCGEACDVDGICGGYNLQWAWTSGKIVGDNI